MKWLHRLYAFFGGYFWLPCPLCGDHFGGHQWRDYDGLSADIDDPSGPEPSSGLAICPRCTRAGRGRTFIRTRT